MNEVKESVLARKVKENEGKMSTWRESTIERLGDGDNLWRSFPFFLYQLQQEISERAGMNATDE